MSAARIDQAMARISAAFERIDSARTRIEASKGESGPGQNSSRVMELVNAHEKLREEVADTLSELDTLIEELEQ